MKYGELDRTDQPINGLQQAQPRRPTCWWVTAGSTVPPSLLMDCRKLNRTNQLFGTGDKHAGHLFEQYVTPEEFAPGYAHTWHICGMSGL